MMTRVRAEVVSATRNKGGVVEFVVTGEVYLTEK